MKKRVLAFVTAAVLAASLGSSTAIARERNLPAGVQNARAGCSVTFSDIVIDPGPPPRPQFSIVIECD